MKKLMCLVMMLLFVSVTLLPAFAADGGSLTTIRPSWQPLDNTGSGTVTSNQSAPGVGARDFATFNSNFYWMEIPELYNGLCIRASGPTADETITCIVYTSDGSDYWPVAQLVFTVGTQSNSNKSTYELADAVVATEYLANGTAYSNAGTEYMAMYVFDRLFAKYVGVVVTGQTSGAFVEIVGY